MQYYLQYLQVIFVWPLDPVSYTHLDVYKRQEKTLTSADREELVVSELRSGYYTLKIFNKQGSVTEKFVKTY